MVQSLLLLFVPFHSLEKLEQIIGNSIWIDLFNANFKTYLNGFET